MLYRLQTDCSLNGTTQRCTVEAFDGRDATVYRTSAKAETLSFRLIDQPERRAAQLWDARSNAWVGLDALSLDFTKNQLCINGQQLCMVNPNFFASIRDDHPNLRSDLIVARFEAKDGRLAAIAWPVTGVVLAVAPVAGGRRSGGRGSGSGALTRPAPGFDRGNRRPAGGWVNRLPGNNTRPIRPSWTRPNRPNWNRPNWNRSNWNRPNWILNRPIQINTINVRPRWWGRGWRRSRPWRYGWYDGGSARWSWWNRSAIGWGITSLASAAVIASAIDRAVDNDQPTVAVDESPYDLVYGSVEATGAQTVSFRFTLSGNAYQASADCGWGLLDGQAPDSPEEAQLLNAACAVAFGSP